jgi:hypothetical protein
VPLVAKLGLIDAKGNILYRPHWGNDHHSLEPVLQQVVESRLPMARQEPAMCA